VDEAIRKQIELHSAGATVRHAGPYSELEVPVMMQNADPDFIATWIKPFYMTNLVSNREEFQSAYSAVRQSIDDALITRLLTYFDWRPRIVGAYFAAIAPTAEHCDHIGRLLLRSDVCYSGTGYALALSRINTEKSVAYLCKYLDYYLQQPELWFDQGAAMGALAHLDSVNNTAIMPSYIEHWNRFVTSKPQWGLDHSIAYFEQKLESLKAIGETAC